MKLAATGFQIAQETESATDIDTLCVFLALKDELHCQLDHAIISGPDPVIPADIVRDPPEIRRIQGNGGTDTIAWRKGVQMIRKIESFRAHLDRPLLSQ